MRLVQSSTIINGAYADTALSWAAMRAVNWLPEAAEADGTRTPRKYATPPGLRLLVDLQTRAPVRGLEDVEGRLFAVSGDSLFEIANDLTVTNRGSIPGVGRVSMAHNQQGGASDANELAIANGLSGYVYNTDTAVLTQITDSAFEGAATFDYVDGYMSYTDPQGRWWGHSDLNQALQYSSIDRNDAESAPDKIVSHIVSHREVIVWGSRTGEFFRNTGAKTGTFQRVDGTEMEVGICATFARARVDNTVGWVGNDLTVYRLNGHAPQRISTRPIEQLLAQVDPTTIFCYPWEDRGHKVLYVTSPNNFTVGFDFASGLWHARESYGLDQWRVNALVRWGNRWVAGDYVNGLLYELDWDWYTENGRPMVSQCATGYTWAEQNKLLCPYAELIFDTGGPEEGTIPDIAMSSYALWTNGNSTSGSFASKLDTDGSFTDSDSVGAPKLELRINRTLGKAYVPANGEILIYATGTSTSAIPAPTSIAFTNSNATSKRMCDIDESVGVAMFSSNQGLTGPALVIFPDDTSSTITGLAVPKWTRAIGGGRFAVHTYNDGEILIYDDSNGYGSPVLTVTGVFLTNGMTADSSGNRLFTTNDWDNDIKRVNTITGGVTSINTSGRNGNLIEYCASLDCVVLQNSGDAGHLYVYDATAGTLTRTLDFTAGDSFQTPQDIGILDALGIVAVSERRTSTYAVHLIDIDTGTVLYTKLLGDSTHQVLSVTADNDHNKVYFSASNTDQIWTVDAVALTDSVLTAPTIANSFIDYA